MNIREITLNNFGKYNNQSTPIEFKDGINVVYGQNEAGKSTLFNGLLTLLYGFKPANRETHPYLTWGESKIELKGVFEDAEGSFAVERKLMSSPSGFVTRNDKDIRINNNSLEQVQDISKESFESIYALTLHDLVKMQDAPWAEVEDRLILNYGMDEIKSPREVLADIDEEMKVLFNPRGQAKKTKVKELEKEIKALKTKRKETMETQESVLEKEALLKTLESNLERALKEETALEKKLQWWKKHESVIDLSQQLEGVEEQSNELSAHLGNVPEGVMTYEELHDKGREMSERQKALQDSINEVESRRQRLTNNEAISVSHQDELEALLKAYQSYERDLALHIASKELLDEKKRQLEQVLSDLLKDISSPQLASLASINLMAIESKIERITALSKDSEALQREIYASAQQPVEKNNLLGIVFLGAGAGVFALGLYLNQAIVNYAAVLLLSFGFFKLFNSKNKSNAEDIKLYDDKIKFNNKKIEEESMMVHQSLAFLSLSKEFIVENGQGLIILLKSAKELTKSFLEKEENYNNKNNLLESTGRALRENIGKIGFEGMHMSPDNLQKLLHEGLKKHQYNARIDVEYRNKEEQLKALTDELETLLKEINKYETYLKSIGEGNTEKGLLILSRFRKLKEKFAFLEEQLMAKDPGGVLQNGIKQIEQNTLKDQNAGENQIRLREIREVVEGIKLEKRSLRSDLEHLLKDVDLFDVESQLLALEDELEEAKESYDQLLLLKTIVSSYDQDYRELHQPDIHRRTGAYFRQITKGKYPKIYNDESIDKTTLIIRQEGEDKEVDANLSQGARDQLYLALRLALADELDKGKSSLPLFLDELFVNWDMIRLEEGIELLKSLSTERQIVLFTCHEWMVDKVKELANPHIIMLES